MTPDQELYVSEIVEDLRDQLSEDRHPVNRYITCSFQGMRAVLDALDEKGSKLDEATKEIERSARDYNELREAHDSKVLRLDEALERDRKGDEIIHGLTLERDSLQRRLGSVCRVEHEWRSSTFHEKSSPHWICEHCGKSEPKKHDEWHSQVRVVERRVSNWVSVAESRPAESTHVLATFKNGDIEIAWFESNDWWGSDRGDEPTHWMPLPQSPHAEHEPGDGLGVWRHNT